MSWFYLVFSCLFFAEDAVSMSEYSTRGHKPCDNCSKPLTSPSPQSLLAKDSLSYPDAHFKISFRVNEASIKNDFKSNQEILRCLRQKVQSPDGEPQIKRLFILSYSSPEGPLRINRKLANERGETAERWLKQLVEDAGLSHEVVIDRRPISENWDGLRHLVEQRYERTDRGELLSILDDASLTTEEKKHHMRDLGWTSWRYVVDSLMTDLRGVECELFFEPVPQPAVQSRATSLPEWQPSQPEKLENLPFEEPQMWTRKATIALKSNLLYDALTWLNIGVEVPFSKNRFSIVYDHQFPWWRGGEGNNHFCMRYLQMSGEFRWWFHPRLKPSTRHQIVRENLTGHFLGVYGMGGKWDFENGRKICYQGEFWSAGLSYGYSMPIGRRLNLEFSISVGYASIPYRHFIPSEDYEHLFRDPSDVGTWSYFGVTKLGVSLVVPINFHRVKKGGRR